VPVRRLPRLLAALAAVLPAVLAVGTPAHAQVVVGVRGTGIQVAPGGQVTVPVVVDMTGSGGFSLAAQLSWTPSTLRYVGATGGAFGAPTLNPDSASGTLRFAVANPAGATGRIVVLNVTFDAIGASGDQTNLDVAVSQLTAAVSFTNLTPVTTSSLLCVGSVSGVWGDVDSSGTLTSFDALLIVTHAVGLAIPYSPALGDVDADGRVTTRDALIVLSHVVGLPTSPYRPGQPLAGACGGPPPATVVAAPASLGLVIGDTVPVTAEARDRLGQIVNVPGFGWTSLDTTVATVGPTGRVAAVGAGVTGAVVAVAPGVMDTVSVTVVTTRSLWYVDVVAASQNQSETGSPAYPFSTLQQAVDRAAPGDTVSVRGGTYGVGATSTKALAIRGHPGFAVPRFGGPITFAAIASGTVRLERLVVADAAEGVRVAGAAAVLVVLDSVGVERVQGRGLDVAGVDSVALRHVTVRGAVGKGLAATGVRALALSRVTVDGVNTGVGGQGTGRTVDVLRAQTFAADSSTFRLGNVVLDTVQSLRLRHVQVAKSFGPLLQLTGASSAILDTVSLLRSGSPTFTGYVASLKMQPGGTVIGRETEIRLIEADGLYVEGASDASFEGLRVEAGGSGAAGAAATFAGVGRVTVRRGSFSDGRVSQADLLGFPDARVMRLDTVDFSFAALTAGFMDTLAIRAAWFAGGAAGARSCRWSASRSPGSPAASLRSMSRARIRSGPTACSCTTTMAPGSTWIRAGRWSRPAAGTSATVRCTPTTAARSSSTSRRCGSRRACSSR
jgi:hypothetical protein